MEFAIISDSKTISTPFSHSLSVLRLVFKHLNKLVRFAHNWNDGMLERWNNGFWPPARRASGSERIVQCWINGPATGGIDDKIKMANILLKTNIPSYLPNGHSGKTILDNCTLYTVYNIRSLHSSNCSTNRR